ncbi:radical SAM domain protein [Halobacteriovorax sp. BALOs_7]|uniref:radical SAM protein n=1 Tax=unclassified Halobacteriovorax TaxID=2639665 RepID=UPI000EA0BA2B|nr:radical SAM protein [Halobacteriovorax sp. BALOs_7]AYF45784.1 radical SAM domain protein [Halobacteriovorax sp. BALOs_7]
MGCKKTTLHRDEIWEVEMDLSGTCNLKCPLCTRNYAHADHLLKRNIRSLEEVIAQLDSFKNLEVFYMAGAVSEPTLYPDVLELCRYLVKRGVAVELFTNGNTHTPEWWAELGEILTSNDRVYFTICGSTQELHEKYRVGSKLKQILDNHQGFISTNKDKIDHIQHIMFKYNRDDFESKEMKEIIDRFSATKFVDTEGQRTFNEYIKSFDKDLIRPENERKRAIDALFNIRPKPGQKKEVEIKCMSLRDRKVYIDQFGRISPCYGHAEYEGPGHFSGEVFDYSEVLSFKFKDCFKCEKRIQKIIDVMELDFVC